MEARQDAPHRKIGASHMKKSSVLLLLVSSFQFLAAQSHFQNVNLSQRLGNQSEVTVAINPTNPRNIVAISNVDVGNGLFKAVSMDGGITWTKSVIANGDVLGVACCDPSLSFDSFGNLFLAFLDAGVTNVQLG